MIDHLSLQVTDVVRSHTFYQALSLRSDSEPGTPTTTQSASPTRSTPRSGSFPQRSSTTASFPSRLQHRVVPLCASFREAACSLGAEILHEPRLFPGYGRISFGTQTATMSKRSAASRSSWRLNQQSGTQPEIGSVGGFGLAQTSRNQVALNPPGRSRELEGRAHGVELRGLEPLTSGLQSRRSTN
jgi:hypothetical protein